MLCIPSVVQFPQHLRGKAGKESLLQEMRKGETLVTALSFEDDGTEGTDEKLREPE